MQLSIGFLFGIAISFTLFYPNLSQAKINAITNQASLTNCQSELIQSKTIIQGMLMNKGD